MDRSSKIIAQGDVVNDYRGNANYYIKGGWINRRLYYRLKTDVA